MFRGLSLDPDLPSRVLGGERYEICKGVNGEFGASRSQTRVFLHVARGLEVQSNVMQFT